MIPAKARVGVAIGATITGAGTSAQGAAGGARVAQAIMQSMALPDLPSGDPDIGISAQ